MFPLEKKGLPIVRRLYAERMKALRRLSDMSIKILRLDGRPPDYPKFVDGAVWMSTIALYMNACKQYRSVLDLCHQWRCTDADAVSRNLFETMVQFLFVMTLIRLSASEMNLFMYASTLEVELALVLTFLCTSAVVANTPSSAIIC